MRTIMLSVDIATTTAKKFYLPVQCRCTVVGFKAVYGAESDADETVILSQGGNAVYTCTPVDGTAAGVILEGAKNGTYGEVVFDPDSATAANKYLQIDTLGTVDAGCVLGLTIQLDESCAITQTASEA